MGSIKSLLSVLLMVVFFPLPSREQTTVNDSVLYHWGFLNAQGSLPNPRAEHSAILETANNRMIIFGGYSQPPTYTLNDLWSLNMSSNAWQQLLPAGTVPPVRAGHGAIYIPDDPGIVHPERMLIFGGRNYFGALYNDTWAYDFSDNSWSQISTAGTPPSARFAFASTFDPVTNRFILFGGKTGGVNYSNETWALNINTNQWTQLPTINTPSHRGGCKAIYDSYSHRMIIFGGYNGTGTLKDAFALNLSTLAWSQMPDYSFPVMGHMSVFEPVLKLMINAGGTLLDSNTVATISTDIGHWLNSSAGGNPPGPVYYSTSVRDAVAKRILLFGGQIPYTAYSNQTWQLTYSVIPYHCQVVQDTINSGETTCYNAWNNITTGGNSNSFFVAPGGSVNLISGNNVSMLLNTRVTSGAYLHAFITSGGQYCDSLSQSSPAFRYPLALFEKDQVSDDINPVTAQPESLFAIRPNPACDQFFIDLHPSVERPVSLLIGNIFGNVVCVKEYRENGIVAVPVSRLPDGLYFVTIRYGSTAKTIKLVKSCR